MALFRVGVVQCRGTPYEVGYAQARWFAETPKGRAFLRRKAIRFPQWFDIRAEQKAFAAFAPAVWEEIAGIADGLAIPMERAVLRFGNAGMRPPTGGCSAVTPLRRDREIDSRSMCHDGGSGGAASANSTRHALQLLAAGRGWRCGGRGSRPRLRRGANRSMAGLHQSFPVAAVATIESPHRALAAEVASTRGVGRPRPHCRSYVCDFESFGLARISPRIFAGCRHTPHYGRRTGQEALVDRNRRRCGGARRRHVGCRFWCLGGRQGSADYASRGPVGRAVPAVPMADPPWEQTQARISKACARAAVISFAALPTASTFSPRSRNATMRHR
jgi:hypothetical protein